MENDQYYRAYIPVLLGMFTGSAAFFLLIALLAMPYPIYVALIITIAAIGFCCMFTITAATIMVTQCGIPQQTGIAAAIFFTGRQFGSLVGVTIFGAIINHSSHLIYGMQYNLFLAGLLFLAVAFGSRIYLRNWSC